MALQAKAYDFEGEEVSPQDRLLRHNQAVRENLQMIVALKEALAEEDLEAAAVYIAETPDSVLDDLWLATTRGGIFTTKERAMIKSDEMGKATRAYIKSKGAV